MITLRTSTRIAGVLLIMGTVPKRALWLIVKGFDDSETSKAQVR